MGNNLAPPGERWRAGWPLVLPFLLAACAMPPQANEFCAEAASLACKKLDNGDCFTAEERAQFGSRDECESSEREYCESLRRDSRYDMTAAAACLDDMERVQCFTFHRGGSTPCNNVFSRSEQSPVERADAGEESQ